MKAHYVKYEIGCMLSSGKRLNTLLLEDNHTAGSVFSFKTINLTSNIHYILSFGL